MFYMVMLNVILSDVSIRSTFSTRKQGRFIIFIYIYSHLQSYWPQVQKPLWPAHYNTIILIFRFRHLIIIISPFSFHHHLVFHHFISSSSSSSSTSSSPSPTSITSMSGALLLCVILRHFLKSYLISDIIPSINKF